MSSPFFSPSLAARKDHAILLREYVSRQSAAKGRAVLEYLGFDGSEIEMFYVKKLKDEEEAVQSGLLEWANGKARSHRPITWEVLIGAMEHGGISVHAIDKLKEELQKGVCTCTYTYVFTGKWCSNALAVSSHEVCCVTMMSRVLLVPSSQTARVGTLLTFRSNALSSPHLT